MKQETKETLRPLLFFLIGFFRFSIIMAVYNFTFNIRNFGLLDYDF